MLHLCLLCTGSNFCYDPRVHLHHLLLQGRLNMQRDTACHYVVCPERNANLQTNDSPCPFCCSSLSDVSQQDSPRQRQEKLQRDQRTKVLQTKRRRAQMRLVNFKRGAIAKPQHGEPLCLEMFVSDLTAALAGPRDTGGRFVSHDSTHASNAFDPVDKSSS